MGSPILLSNGSSGCWLAAYGLRPHPIFKLDCSELDSEPGWLLVLPDSKTADRLILPLRPICRSEWKL